MELKGLENVDSLKGIFKVSTLISDNKPSKNEGKESVWQQ